MLLLDHFRELTEAPGAAAHLRRLILDMAVRGQLVEQDPEDEPAGELLERIREERARRVKAGELKRAGPQVKAISKEEKPFDLPVGWVWCRLGEVVNLEMGQSPPGNTYNSTGQGTVLVNGPVEFSEGPFGRTKSIKWTTAPTKLADAGDLLLCVRGSTTGRTNILSESGCIGRGVAAIQPHFYPWFIYYFILKYRQSIYDAGRGSTFPNISKKQIIAIPFPLPPLTEQHRIVARVETLLGQLEELDATATRRAAAADRLVPALLNGLAEADDLATYWRERLVPNFGLFTEREAYCAQLRRLILDLAVRGRLTPQQPEEEPASVLLERIRAERARRVQAGEIRKGKKLPAIDPKEVPFGLPAGWVWCRFAELIVDSNNGISSGKHNTEGIGRPHLRPMNIDSKGNIDLSVLKYTEKEADTALKKNDLFFNNTNSNVMVGKTTLIEEDTDWLYSNHMTRIACFDELIDMHYVKLYYNQLFEAGFFRGICRQYINQASVNLTYLKTELLFPLPPLPEQRRLVERVEGLLGQVAALRAGVARRGELREAVWGAIC